MLSVRLKSARKAKNLTQNDLAKKVSTTKATISNYENGHSTPSNDMLLLLSNALDVTTDYLLGRSHIPQTNSSDSQSNKSLFISKITTEFPDIELMFKDMESLSAEDMQEVYEYIKFKKSQKKEE